MGCRHRVHFLMGSLPILERRLGNLSYSIRCEHCGFIIHGNYVPGHKEKVKVLWKFDGTEPNGEFTILGAEPMTTKKIPYVQPQHMQFWMTCFRSAFENSLTPDVQEATKIAADAADLSVEQLKLREKGEGSL